MQGGRPGLGLNNGMNFRGVPGRVEGVGDVTSRYPSNELCGASCMREGKGAYS